LVLTPIGFQSVILTSINSSILLRCHRHFILDWIGPDIFLNVCLSKTDKFVSRTDISHA
jgi:hypothetical protein